MPQVYSLPQISTDKWLDNERLFDEKAESDWSQLALMSGRAKAKRDRFLKYLLVVYVKGELDLGLPLQRNAEFSYAFAVMGKFGGWEEGNEREDQIGARFGASMWIHTKAVDGPRHMENFMMNKINSITEAVNGAWGILYEDHECIPQNSIQAPRMRSVGVFAL